MSNLLDMIPQLSSSIITNYQVEENLLYIVFNNKMEQIEALSNNIHNGWLPNVFNSSRNSSVIKLALLYSDWYQT